jgi:hypothetical protein
VDRIFRAKTPAAMPARVSDHQWTFPELFGYASSCQDDSPLFAAKSSIFALLTLFLEPQIGHGASQVSARPRNK